MKRLVLLAVALLLPVGVHAQTPDSLPLLSPAGYIPAQLDGFSQTSESGLSSTDRQVMTGVQSGRKSYWVKKDRPFEVVAFDISIAAYSYSAADHAHAHVVTDLRKSASDVSRDTIAGVPVWVGVDRAGHRRTGTADVWIRYQQGRLALDVWATKSLTSGAASLEQVENAAWQAFQQIAETARSNE